MCRSAAILERCGRCHWSALLLRERAVRGRSPTAVGLRLSHRQRCGRAFGLPRPANRRAAGAGLGPSGGWSFLPLSLSRAKIEEMRMERWRGDEWKAGHDGDESFSSVPFNNCQFKVGTFPTLHTCTLTHLHTQRRKWGMHAASNPEAKGGS